MISRTGRRLLRYWWCPDSVVRALRLFVVLATVASALWVWTQRRGGTWDIDEAGYLAMALRDWHGFGRGGLSQWYDTINLQPVQAPAVPAAASLLFVVFGGHVVIALAVPLLCYLAVGLMTIELSRPLGRVANVVCSALVITAPVFLVYSRSFHFAVPAAAVLTFTIVAQVHSRHLLRTRWSIAWGVSLGLLVLTRTMTVAFLPGIFLAALLPCVAAPTRRRWANLVAGIVAGVLTASLWYVQNLDGVLDYLRSFGYGKDASRYGQKRSLLSYDDWAEFFRVQTEGYFQLFTSLVAVIGGLAALAVLAARLRTWTRADVVRIARAPPLPLVCGIIAAPGIAALVSSRNQGSAFILPIVVPMTVIAGWGIDRLLGFAAGRSWGRRLRVGVAAVTCVALLPAAIVTFAPMGSHYTADIDLPGWPGGDRVLDAHSTLRLYARYGLTEDQLDEQIANSDRWVAVAAQVYELTYQNAEADQRTPMVLFTFRHRLFNVNNLSMQSLLDPAHAEVWAGWVEPITDGTTADYVQQVQQYRSVALIVLTATPGPLDMDVAIPPEVGDTLVGEWGLGKLADIPMPDGRLLTVWKVPPP